MRSILHLVSESWRSAFLHAHSSNLSKCNSPDAPGYEYRIKRRVPIYIGSLEFTAIPELSRSNGVYLASRVLSMQYWPVVGTGKCLAVHLYRMTRGYMTRTKVWPKFGSNISNSGQQYLTRSDKCLVIHLG